MGISSGYARPELLAEPDWLSERGDDPHLRIIDCGDPAGYDRAHIPNAVRLVREEDTVEVGSPQWLKDPADRLHVLDAEGVATLAEHLGISDDTTVVAYDDYNGSFATRLWWILTYYGHPDVKVLNGGWQRWLDEADPRRSERTCQHRAPSCHVPTRRCACASTS
jgi:thiosulfate/3-mercaptopyruvate sulfurtransferase